jgi:hypothetical protein
MIISTRPVHRGLWPGIPGAVQDLLEEQLFQAFGRLGEREQGNEVDGLEARPQERKLGRRRFEIGDKTLRRVALRTGSRRVDVFSEFVYTWLVRTNKRGN